MVPAVPEHASRVRREAFAFALAHDVPDPPAAGLRLALGEAVANAVVHAYGDGPPGEISVRMTIAPEAGRVRVVVCDRGAGMLPRVNSPGLGLGLPLMARVTDELQIRARLDEAGTEVDMTFIIPSPVLAGCA